MKPWRVISFLLAEAVADPNVTTREVDAQSEVAEDERQDDSDDLLISGWALLLGSYGITALPGITLTALGQELAWTLLIPVGGSAAFGTHLLGEAGGGFAVFYGIFGTVFWLSSLAQVAGVVLLAVAYGSDGDGAPARSAAEGNRGSAGRCPPRVAGWDRPAATFGWTLAW